MGETVARLAMVQADHVEVALQDGYQHLLVVSLNGVMDWEAAVGVLQHCVGALGHDALGDLHPKGVFARRNDVQQGLLLVGRLEVDVVDRGHPLREVGRPQGLDEVDCLVPAELFLQPYNLDFTTFSFPMSSDQYLLKLVLKCKN